MSGRRSLPFGKRNGTARFEVLIIVITVPAGLYIVRVRTGGNVSPLPYMFLQFAHGKKNLMYCPVRRLTCAPDGHLQSLKIPDAV